MKASKIFSILATLFSTSPAVAVAQASSVTLAHPNIPIFKACAVNMDVNGEAVADRILAVGWTEMDLTTQLQDLGRDHAALRYFGPSVSLGEVTKSDWDASMNELRFTRDKDQYGGEAEDGSITRAFEDPGGSGFAVVTSMSDGFWSCEIVLTEASLGAAQFMSNAPKNGDRDATDGLIYVSDDNRMDELAAGPITGTPTTYYCGYLLAEPDTIERRYGQRVRLVFAAEFATDYAF